MFARLFSLLGARKCSSLYVDYLTGNASNQEHEVTIIPGVVEVLYAVPWCGQ